MSSKTEKDKQKAVQAKCHAHLNKMLRDEDNKYCVDCDAKGPRWASWNLGIFLCIRCAGIHRNLGVHISKVKSVNLDAWTPEQVVSLQQMGNSRARAVYEANLPDNFRRPQTDAPLESFIRAKYEQKKYIAREWVPPTIPKVNWDKEIEEEEQARRRKKESKSGIPPSSKVGSPAGHSISSEIPAPLPKPKSSASPKPARIVMNSSASPSCSSSTVASSGTLDLLGLDTPNKGDDIFCAFLSAPPLSSTSASINPPSTAPDSAKNEAISHSGDSKRSVEENNFFNQPTAAVQEKKQLTKDSILALYSSVPSSSPSQTQSQSFIGLPGPVFPAQGFGAGPAPSSSMGLNFSLPNGMMMGQSIQQASNNPQAPVFVGVGGQPVMLNAGGTSAVGISNSSNPFFNMTGSTPLPNTFSLQNQVNQEHDSSSNLLDLGGVLSSSTAISLPPQLPQQMNILNLSGPPVGSSFAQHGLSMPNPRATSTSSQPNIGPGIMNLSQTSFPQGQASLGHTLASNLWQ